MNYRSNDIGSILKLRTGDLYNLVAGDAKDGVKQTGDTVDRYDSNSRNAAQSLKLGVAWLATLAAAKTISITIEYQDSSDASTWNTAVAVQEVTVVGTGESGGSTETGIIEWDKDLSALDRYIRFNLTVTMSAAATDVANVAAIVTLGGFSENPPS